jgi:pimeloyl-ACP methyl ester carboxylesterase
VEGDAAYVASFLTQRTTGPVVLVGHSYGGVVITNAGAAGGDVKALVYVDAFIPDMGENTFQILGGSGSAFDVPDPNAVFDIVGYPGAPEGDAEAFLKPSTVHESFAQDLPEADRWLIVASQRPITLGANTAPTQATAWRTIPSWTVIGTRTASSPRPRNAEWRSGPARRSPKSRDRTYRWCPIPGARSTPSSLPWLPSAANAFHRRTGLIR